MKSSAGFNLLLVEVIALKRDMRELRRTLNWLISRYPNDSCPLAESLIRQSLCRINALYLEAYKEVLALDDCFRD